MTNKKIAQVFQEIGDILEILGENRFKVLAYQRAAQMISGYPEDLKDIWEREPKDLREIPGVGLALADKIEEILLTGHCKYHQELLLGVPPGVLQMLRVRGLGPKKVKLFWENLGIDTIAKLRKAAERHKLRDLPRMGAKSEEVILKALAEFEKGLERMKLSVAWDLAEDYADYMRGCKAVELIEIAGSVRRRKETCKDIDLLVVAKKVDDVVDHFVKYPDVSRILGAGKTKVSIVLSDGVEVDMRIVKKVKKKT